MTNLSTTSGKSSVNPPPRCENISRPDMRALAVSYAEKGYHVLCLVPDGKNPSCKGGKNNATNDPENARQWWTGPDGSPENDNVGIRCKGLCVFDFDVKDGRTMLEHQNAVIKKYGEGFLRGAPASKTPSDGRHLLFRLPKGIMRVPTSIKKMPFLPGVDIIGEADYIVAPGSYTKADPDKKISAGHYTLRGGLKELPPVAELPELPAAALDDVLAAGGKTREWAMGRDDGRADPSGAPPADFISPDHPVDTEDQFAKGRAYLRDEAKEAVDGTGAHEVKKRPSFSWAISG
jgi:hypothetical protein